MRIVLSCLLVLIFCLGGMSAVRWFAYRKHDDATISRDARQIEDDSHEQMVLALQKVREQSLTDNPYFATQSRDVTARELDQTPLRGNEQRHFALHLLRMENHRKLGENTKAVEHLLRAEQIWSKANLSFSPEAIRL